MRPLHASITRLSRCPCCVSKYSKHAAARSGKRAARHREARKESDNVRT